MVDHLVAADLLRPVLRAYEPPPIPIHIVYPAGRHLPQTTRLFVDQLAAALREKFAAEPRGEVRAAEPTTETRTARRVALRLLHDLRH